ncbi:MAG TPA: hypothetical protein VI669_02675 [Vicinamibacteria bacterium]
MPARLADSLLALAASIDGDGGHAVCKTLGLLLRDTAPFDAGEVVLRQGEGFHRFPFGGDERPVAGDDLVRHVLANGAALRLDDPRDLEPFPATRERMAPGGLKSALALPLGVTLHVQASRPAAEPNGVLIVARRHGWAFVGASLHFLGPVAAMAGLALDRALALTALGHPGASEPGAETPTREALRHEGASLVAELQTLRSVSVASAHELATLRSSLASVRDELANSRGATIAAQSALDQAVGRCHELEARLERDEVRSPRGSNGGEAPPAEQVPAQARDAEGPPVRVSDAQAVSETDEPPGEGSAPAGADEPPRATEPAETEGREVAALPVRHERLSRRARRRRRGAFEPGAA